MRKPCDVQAFPYPQNKLVVDGFDVPLRIDGAIYVRDVGIVETAHHMHDCVHFPYVRKELVSKPFALACALDKTCDIHKFKRRGSDFLLS